MARILSKEEQEALERVAMKFNLSKKWLEQGIEEGMKQGIKEGIEEGIKEGMKEGIKEGEIASLIRVLNKKFNGIPNEVIEEVRKIDDIIIINKILDNIFEIESIDELKKYLV